MVDALAHPVRILPSLALAAVLVGCGGGGASAPAPLERVLRLDTLVIAMERGANANSPGRVDLVRVADPALVDKLLAIDTATWFETQRDAFRNAHPEAFIDEWEPVPGVVVGPEPVALDADLAGVLFCAAARADPPIRLERDGDLIVQVTDAGCEVRGGMPSKAPEEGGFSLSNPFKGLMNLFEGLMGLFTGG